MIISRTPFRLSFAGGGSDLPSYYLEEEGAVLSTALNKYMYVTVNKRFDESIRLSYSKTEIRNSVSEIDHPIFKLVLEEEAKEGGLEIISMADIPSGTGLGSSSSFTVGLLHALRGFKGQFQTAEELARDACITEIEKLKEPIGKQDQYIAAYGGLQYIRFLPSGDVCVDPIVCTEDTRKKLESHCMLFFTGLTRDAKTVLSEQKASTNNKRDTLREMVSMASEMKSLLETNPRSLDGFGQLLNAAWELKKSVSQKISNPSIDKWYEQALDAGAWGGKILGAGAGGFLMIFCDPSRHDKVKNALEELKPFDVAFERQGSKIIFMG